MGLGKVISATLPPSKSAMSAVSASSTIDTNKNQGVRLVCVDTCSSQPPHAMSIFTSQCNENEITDNILVLQRRLLCNSCCVHDVQAHPSVYESLPVSSSFRLPWRCLSWPFGLQSPEREASLRPSPRPLLVERLRSMAFPRLPPSPLLPRRPSLPEINGTTRFRAIVVVKHRRV